VSAPGRHLGRPLHHVMGATDIPKVTHTLLLADDSVTIQRVIELTFADEDVEVIAVGDGDQAIERLEASPPDIVLADIGMPGRNGYEVAKYIKQSPRLAHIPVVLLTGAFEPVDQARASEAGCDGVLAKPFEPQLVISRVKDLLAKRRQAPAPAADHVPAADHWPSPMPEAVAAARPAESAAPPVPPPAPASVEPLGSYFDRLDSAFSRFSHEPLPEPPKAPEPPQASPSPGDIDWFGAAKRDTAASMPEWDAPLTPPVEPPDRPLSFSAPEVREEPEAPRTIEAVAEAAPAAELWPAAEPLHVEETPSAPAFSAWLTASSESAAPVPVPAPEMSPFEEARSDEVAAFVEHTAPVEHAAPVDDAAPVEHAAPGEDAVAAEPSSPVEDAAAVEHLVFVEHAAPHGDAPLAAALVAEWTEPEELVALTDMPEVAASPQPAAPPEPFAYAAPAVTPAPVASPPPMVHALPSLADAFAALLAAEKEEERPAMVPIWPASAPSSSLAQDEVVEQVTRRVLDHLSDRVVRETVSDLVSSIAERLVREEIERIKASIR
jgi:CheY-like chemotaxis protein